MSWDPWEPSLVSPIRMIIIGHPGRFFGMHRLPVPGRLWQVHYTFNLRDFASKCHRQHVNVNRILMPHIWMPLICHKYIWCIWGTFGEYGVPPVFGVCVWSSQECDGVARHVRLQVHEKLGVSVSDRETTSRGNDGEPKENHPQMPIELFISW